MMQRRAFLVAGLGALTASSAVRAHHGWSHYDATKTLTLTGKIVEAAYDYPHAMIRLQTADRTWLCVLAPPYRMDSRGLPRDALKSGATATVVGYPDRDGGDEMRAERITLGDRTVELR
jgi:hypothetical protein